MSRLERLRSALDSYMLGVERGRDYAGRFPERTEPKIESRLGCTCRECRAQGVGFAAGFWAEKTTD